MENKLNRLNFTTKQKNRNKKLKALLSELRPGIKRKRNKNSKAIATLEAAREIISHKEFWTQSTWFDTSTEGKTGGAWLATTYRELELELERKYENEICADDAVCRVCADGAIHLAANNIADGEYASTAINNYLYDENGVALPDINDNRSKYIARKETLGAFDRGIAALKKEWKVK